MSMKQAFLSQVSNLPNSYVPKIEDFFLTPQTEDASIPTRKISAYNEPNFTVKEPKLSQWGYIEQKEVETLLNFENNTDISNFIGSTIKICPKGKAKDLFIQLMCDVLQYCKKCKFTVEKSGTVLSQFYQTHIYFTSGYDISAEKVYVYFKDLIMCHSLPFPPSSKKILSLKEARETLEFFCKIYLRNLPLIRYLCLPNFALYLNYEVPPPPVLQFKAKKEPKKKKEGKKGKKK